MSVKTDLAMTGHGLVSATRHQRCVVSRACCLARKMYVAWLLIHSHRTCSMRGRKARERCARAMAAKRGAKPV
jgi:hypothetical protein